MSDPHTLEDRAWAALLLDTPDAKCNAVHTLRQDWLAGSAPRSAAPAVRPRLERPGRPARPELVAADAVPRRSPHTPDGHAALLHAIAHIEFNAINLALDCVARFAWMPEAFADDWLRVAEEEATHFGLLAARLAALGCAYGDFPAHNGLWEMAVKTDGDVLARMALVPRVLEARGLDATPPIVARLRQVPDPGTIAILDIILHDEIGHVAVGDRWFRTVCAERGRVPEAEYLRLIDLFEAPRPRPPFNRPARRAAGFSEAELDALEAAALRPARRSPAE